MLLTSRRSEFRGARNRNKRRDFIFRLFIWRQRTTTFYLVWIWSKKRFDFFVTRRRFHRCYVWFEENDDNIKLRAEAFNSSRFPLFHCAADEGFRYRDARQLRAHCFISGSIILSCPLPFQFARGMSKIYSRMSEGRTGAQFALFCAQDSRSLHFRHESSVWNLLRATFFKAHLHNVRSWPKYVCVPSPSPSSTVEILERPLNNRMAFAVPAQETQFKALLQHWTAPESCRLSFAFIQNKDAC